MIRAAAPISAMLKATRATALRVQRCVGSEFWRIREKLGNRDVECLSKSINDVNRHVSRFALDVRNERTIYTAKLRQIILRQFTGSPKPPEVLSKQ